MAFQAGLSASLQRTVGTADLAPAMSSGDVAVLATPHVVAWCEAATIAAIDGHLGESETTVGMRVRIDHVSPSGLGSIVDVSAELTLVEGRRLTFSVSACDKDAEIAVGNVVRVIVDRERFLERV